MVPGGGVLLPAPFPFPDSGDNKGVAGSLGLALDLAAVTLRLALTLRPAVVTTFLFLVEVTVAADATVALWVNTHEAHPDILKNTKKGASTQGIIVET